MNNTKTRFALIGAAGYIAIRHVKAIKETGNDLTATLDLFDSVGFLDAYFPNTDFFTEYERFDRHVDKLKRKDKKIDYVSICTPNYLHDSHIRFALKNDAHAICEKPLVLNPWNIDGLAEMEQETGKKINTILQLRLHPSIIALKEKIANGPKDKVYDVDLAYLTSRGNWYHYSWKGNPEQSGGIGTNIGIHFFDLLMWLFGKPDKVELYTREQNRMGGFLELPNADVEWFLSLEPEDIPGNMDESQRTYRSITVDDDEVEFSGGFTDLHTRVYEETLNGNGFGINDARPSIELVHKLRTMKLTEKPNGLVHPIIRELKKG